MKRLLILLCALMLCGCTKDAPKLQAPVNFYYLRPVITCGSADSVVFAAQFEGAGHENDLRYLLDAYLSTASSEQFRNPFPVGTILREITSDGNHYTLEFSNQLAQLSGMDLTVACACIAKTVMGLTDAQSVEIRTRSIPLGDTGSIIMDANTILLLDDAAMDPA